VERAVAPSFLRAVDLRRVERRAATPFALLALAFAAFTLYANARGSQYGFDFHGGIWKAGQDLLAGRSPYPDADAGGLLVPGNAYVLPPLLGVIAVPFSVLPFTLAIVLWNVVCAAALVAALALLGVRDRRIYLLALCSFPFVASLALGQPDGLLALAAALAWRFRGSWKGGLAVGALIAAKLFAWPLVIWLLATRRFRAAAVAAGSSLLFTGLSWALFGFKGLTAYPRLLAADARAFEVRSHSVVALALRLGASEELGRLLMVGVAVALALIALRVSRGGDLGWFSVALAFGLLTSPILWSHYLTLLFVPLAISRRRADAIWLLTIAFWLSHQEPPAHVWQVGLVLLTIGAVTALGVAGPSSPAGARSTGKLGRNRPLVAANP
jgi:hypothetical protein